MAEGLLGGAVESVVLHHARDHIEVLAGFFGGGFLREEGVLV